MPLGSGLMPVSGDEYEVLLRDGVVKVFALREDVILNEVADILNEANPCEEVDAKIVEIVDTDRQGVVMITLRRHKETEQT